MRNFLKDQHGFSFQLCSDLHLEFFENYPDPQQLINPLADVLFLAGDVFHPHEQNAEAWILSVCQLFKVVVFVNGNHEFYQKRGRNRTVAEVRAKVAELGHLVENFVVLDPGAVTVGGVRIIGATLWSYVPLSSRAHVQATLNDYNLCYTAAQPQLVTLTVDETVHQHERELQFITDQMKEARRASQKCVVVSHHCPMLNFTSNKEFEGAMRNPTLHAFATDLLYLFKDYGCADNSTCEYWLYGHSHHNLDDNFYGTQVYSNQRGYQRGQRNPSHTGEPYSMDTVKQVW